MKQDHAGHRLRMRERFEQEGLDSMQPHEVLELLLFYAIPRGDTNPIAHRLMTAFGSISGVFEASYDDLMKIEGIGASSATLLRTIPSVTRRYLGDKFSKGVVLNSTEKLGEYIIPQFIGRNKEVVLLLCFDLKRKLLSCDVLLEGSLDSVGIDLRKIAERSMSISAAGIVLAHNHTHGFALPSAADRHATRVIKQALLPFAIQLIDHIIVSRDDFVSMADSGFLLE